MGIIEGLLGDLAMFVEAGLGLFPVILEILFVGGFLYFLLSKFWWKPMQEKKAESNNKKSEKEN